MNNAKLTSITIENLKSFRDSTRIPVEPLTVIVGRNNSGKSTIIQSLLLLKQTINDPRDYIQLKLDGIVEAFNLREITFGWPQTGANVPGPTLALEWSSHVDVRAALEKARRPDFDNLANFSKVQWLQGWSDEHLRPEKLTVNSAIRIQTQDHNGSAVLSMVEVEVRVDEYEGESYLLKILPDGDSWRGEWLGQRVNRIQVEFDHFIPYLRIDRSRVGPRHAERAWHNAYLILFEQPLEALKKILLDLFYLGSHRTPPSSLFRPATTDPVEIGINGDYAAQILHRKQNEIVHFLPPCRLQPDGTLDDCRMNVKASPLGDAINQIMQSLSIAAPLQVKDIADTGFQLLFGDANIVHVGQGLNYLLPLIELGLFADPIRFSGEAGELSLEEYGARCRSFSHIALEEPEAHLHPKVASRLAHFFVSLAMARRQLIVETHSDHLVRRLRGLAARAKTGGEFERWLLKNVVILNVSQDEDGCSHVTESRLTSGGGLEEIWPDDFMDEATDEESAIYYAKLDKSPPGYDGSVQVEMVEGDEPDDHEAP